MSQQCRPFFSSPSNGLGMRLQSAMTLRIVPLVVIHHHTQPLCVLAWYGYGVYTHADLVSGVPLQWSPLPDRASCGWGHLLCGDRGGTTWTYPAMLPHIHLGIVL